MLTPLRLVRLIREHCKKFSVLVPYRAHSAATSIALGADEIVMGKLAELSPVDPSTDHPFNPQNPVTPQQRLQISVEDIASFFALAKERASIQSEQMIEVFRQLAAQVHPLALGNADRTYRMARALTGKLLALHLDPEKEKAKIDAIIAKLTQDLSIHGYPISRREARDEIGLKVLIPDEDLESAMWDLMESYEDHLKLLETFDPASLAKPGPPAIIERPAACIESISRLDEFAFKVAVGQVASPGGQPMFNVNIQPGVWVKR